VAFLQSWSRSTTCGTAKAENWFFNRFHHREPVASGCGFQQPATTCYRDQLNAIFWHSGHQISLCGRYLSACKSLLRGMDRFNVPRQTRLAGVLMRRGWQN
jgi:hypothetical protein